MEMVIKEEKMQGEEGADRRGSGAPPANAGSSQSELSSRCSVAAQRFDARRGLCVSLSLLHICGATKGPSSASENGAVGADR